jgi:thioredoxin 1
MAAEQIFTDQNFDTNVMQSDVPVLVDFYAVWCGPCKMMAPVIEELAEEYVGRVKIGKFDVDENPVISERFSVQSIPTILLINGGEVVDKMVGIQSKDKLQDKLDALVK